MGTLKKFRFDEKYSDILNFVDLQSIYDVFYSKRDAKYEIGEQSNMNSKALYMNSEQKINIKNECFDKLYQLVCDNIGQFYLIYSQLHFHKDKNKDI